MDELRKAGTSRLDAGVKLATMLRIALMMVTKKPDHQEEREGNRKTIAQGRPIAKGVPVVTEACVSFRFARKAMGAIFAPAFPAPSFLGG